ncbi:dienelactone hydrolase family protein [Streptomyces sp. NPDC058221]|uniref:dienelactone hydrolase family protein n=1 Tax=Streptomyces sp. NPDC058221 TaxID=3346388 RepID=UPI0036EC458B
MNDSQNLEMKMHAATETLSTQDGPMKLYEAVPGASAVAPRSAVIVIQEGFGVDPYIQSLAHRYAEAGHLAVAPHLFHRTGDPELGYDDPTLAFPHIRALTQEGLLTDAAATLGHIEQSGIPASRVGVIGFSMGGSVVMALSAALALGAGVSFCGGGGGGLTQARLFGLPPLIEVAKGFRTPWLGHFGDLDEYIPIAEVEQLRAAAALSPVDTEVVRYAEAGHDFYCDARPQHLHEKSAVEAWRLTDEFLDHRLRN